MKRKRKEPHPREDNIIKYWNHNTKKWSDKLWSVDYKNSNNNKNELYPRHWFNATKQEMIQRNDRKNLRPITCNVTKSLDNILIKSVKKEQILLQ